MPNGHIDEYTRIEVYLPFRTPQEVRAGLDTIDYVKSARSASGRYRYRGMTHSVQFPPVFQGAWWSKTQRKWVIDKLVILSLDLPIRYSDFSQVAQEADGLKRQIAQFYSNAQAPQHDIWVITYAVGYVP